MDLAANHDQEFKQNYGHSPTESFWQQTYIYRNLTALLRLVTLTFGLAGLEL